MSFRGVLAVAVTLAAALCASCGPKVCTEMCQPLTISVEMPHGGTPFPVTAGATVPWEHGFQGGTMITPQVVVTGAPFADGDEVDLTITHMPDPAAPDALGEASGFPRYHARVPARTDETGRTVIGPVTDQVGWGDLDGVRMIFTIDVATVTHRASFTAAITLGSPTPAACLGFAEQTTPAGCRYRVVPGTATVTTDLDSVTIGGACDGRTGRYVLLGFAPDDPTNAMACAYGSGAGSYDMVGLDFMGSDIISPACQSAHMLGMGASQRTNLWVRTAGMLGTCDLMMLKDVDDAIATCSCPP